MVGSLATGPLPAQIIAADLNGNGLTDLVVRNAGDGTLSVFYGTAFDRSTFRPDQPQYIPPPFLPAMTIPVGLGVSDVQAVDTTGSGRLDLVVTNKLTGQVGIVQNLGDGTFGPLEPYRAGTGLSAIDTSGSPEVTSLEATAGVAAGPLTPGGPTDLVTINPGSNTLGVLAGLGGGRFANPVDHPDPATRAGHSHGRPHRQRHRGPGPPRHQPGERHAGQRPRRFPEARELRRGARAHRPDGRRHQRRRHTRSPDRQRVRRFAHLAGQRRRHLPPLSRGQPGRGAGRGRSDRQRQARFHLRRPGARSRGRPVRHQPDHGAGRPGNRPALPRRRRAGRPDRRRHPRPDRRQQRVEQRARLSRAGQRPVRPGDSMAGMATSSAPTRPGSRSRT